MKIIYADEDLEDDPPEREIHCTVTKRRWLNLEFTLTGDLEATVEYNGRGFGCEKVIVNGDWEYEESILWGFAPHFDFEIATGNKTADGEDKVLLASLDVRISPWFTIQSIRLKISDRIIYAEGKLKHSEGEWV